MMLAGYRLNTTEQGYGDLEKLLIIVSWATRKFPGFFLRCQSVVAHLPLPEMVQCVNDRGVNLKLRARLIDMDSIGVTWKKGKSMYAALSQILSIA